MPTDENKTYSLNFSSQMILGLILTGLPVIGGAGYGGMKFYGKMMETIEAVDKFKPYNDGPLREQLQTLQIEMQAMKERQIQTAEAVVRIAERSSDAIALARETKAVALGTATESAAMGRETKSLAESQVREVKAALDSQQRELKVSLTSQQREVETRLASLKQDLDATAAALRSEMSVLKRATTNPLGR
jgi:hypothetical protein